MEQKKRKISVRKVLLTIVTLLMTTGCIMAVTSASNIQEKRTISKLEVSIKNGKTIHFLSETQLYDMLVEDKYVFVNHTPISEVPLAKIETLLNKNPWVKKADVYVDNKGIMHVDVLQRSPSLRVFGKKGNSYYLDSSLTVVPLSERFSPYTMVVTNVPELKNDSASKSIKSKLLYVVNTLSRDSFWNAQTSELYMTNSGGFELIPILGNHRIILDDTDMLERKLKNVFLFYNQVLSRIGWDKYDKIDVSYKGQVVASPALVWNKPKDKAMNNMNWVETILGKELVEKLDAAAMPSPVAAVPVPQPAPERVAAPVVTPKPVPKSQEIIRKAAAKKEDKSKGKQPKYIYQQKH